MTILRILQFSGASGTSFGTTSPSAAMAAQACPDAWYKWLAAMLLVSGVIGGLAIARAVKPTTLALEPGIGMFAVLFLVAQTIERLLEVLQLLFPRIGSTPDSARKRAEHFKDDLAFHAEMEAKLVKARKPTILGLSIDKQGARQAMARAMADATNNGDKVSLQVAAEAKSVVETIELNRTLLSWSLASCFAMLGSAALGLYLIDTIVISTAPPKVIDLIVTGLVIGAGTKPLHDLIKNIESSKNAEKA